MTDKEPTKSEWIEVKSSSIHNKGIFAAKDIPKDTKIIEYVGKKVSKAESNEISDREIEKSKSNPEEFGSVYLFTLNKNTDINGNVSWNTARLINHSCDPNCESDIIKGKVWIKATKNIKKGEELGYDYGYDIANYEDHVCKCGSKNCIGYIINSDQWINLRKKLRKQKKKKQKN
jgi:SET domain-containing protein